MFIFFLAVNKVKYAYVISALVTHSPRFSHYCIALLDSGYCAKSKGNFIQKQTPTRFPDSGDLSNCLNSAFNVRIT